MANIIPYAHYYSKLFGKMFSLSTTRGYDTKEFVKKVMTDENISYIINSDSGAEWSDEYFMLGQLERKVTFKKGTVEEELYFLEWLGYQYKYWMLYRGTSSSEIYRLYPYERAYVCFGFHHTQDWEYVIDDVIRRQGEFEI